MSNPPAPNSPPSGGMTVKDRNTIILLIVAVIGIIAVLATLPSMFGGKTNDDGGREAASIEAAYRQMQDYQWAFPPPSPPAPAPFTEDPGVLSAVQDSTALEFAPLDAAALDYLLHKARTAASELDTAAGIPYEELTVQPGVSRGRPLRVLGNLQTLMQRRLDKPGRAGLDVVYEGSLLDAENRRYFFTVADYPLNLYPPDSVALTGYFQQVHGDPDTRDVGPLIVGCRLTRPAPPPLLLDDTILEKLVHDDETDDIRTVSLAGWHYLLHKLRTQDAAALEKDALRGVPLLEMIQQPRQVRGKPVRVEGMLMSYAERVKVGAGNSSGLENVYMGFLGNSEGLFRFTVIDPPLLEKGSTVVLYGYYLQRMSHIDKHNNPILTPMIVGQALRPVQRPQPAQNNGVVWLAGLLALGTLVVVYVLNQMESRMSAAYMQASRERFRRGDLNLKEGAERLIKAREASMQKPKPPSAGANPPNEAPPPA